MSRRRKSRAQSSVSKEQIVAGLMRVGLKKGNVIGVHSSLSNFGSVDGGAGTVIDALLDVVGKDGTVVMPTFSTNRTILDLTTEMKAAGASWLIKMLPYDPEQTPCWTGIVPETFRKRSNALRSLHPMFSLAAIGPKAKTIVEAGREGALPAWKKVLELDGYVLLIGVGLNRCTAMHLAEERVKLPKHIQDRLTPPKWFIEKYPPDKWDWDFGPYPDFKKMEQPFLEKGIMKTARVGKASFKLLKLKDLIDLYTKYLQKDPDIFYH